MKTQEELNAIKEEVETLNKKLAELSEEELTQVSGGDAPSILTKLGLDLGISYKPVFENPDFDGVQFYVVEDPALK